MVELANTNYVFERVEKKYLVPAGKLGPLLHALRGYVEEDAYGQYTICNLYYDTKNYDLIRRSLEKPKYKEKLRLRSYGVPTSDTPTFLEIKKKYNGVVYKRRVQLPYSAAMAYLEDGVMPSCGDCQILKEIDYLLGYYKPTPKLYLAYDRVAFCGLEDPSLRITFDENIRSRRTALELSSGDYGEPLFTNGERLMEIKAGAALPLWLTKILSEHKIYPVSFSKYGNIYLKNLQAKEAPTCLPV